MTAETPSDISRLTLQLEALEQSLLLGPGRYDTAFLDAVLHPSFCEVDARGRVTERSDAVRWLLLKDPETTWAISAFRVMSVHKNLVVSQYVATKNPDRQPSRTGHIGIWKMTRNQWQLMYHQGSYLP